MKTLILILSLLSVLQAPVRAVDPSVPVPSGDALLLMPEHTENLNSGLRELLQNALMAFRPDLIEASKISVSLIAASMLLSILKTFEGTVGRVCDLAGCAAVASGLLMTSDSMIRLGTETICEITEYGKLLIPVMTGALAAQGGVTKSSALFAGTLGFTALLSKILSDFLIPMLYFYLALSIGAGALGNDSLKKLRDLIKTMISWCLKTLITLFTSYIGLTGVISGTTDAAALKAAKAAVSSMVPVVGNILSGASETMLLSAAIFKNTAGLYGIFAVLTIFIHPFLRIFAHYWILKLTGGLCSVFGSGSLSDLIGDFSSAMGFLLAMTGTACFLILLGTACFMKGVI